jgi:hypothetical protein
MIAVFDDLPRAERTPSQKREGGGRQSRRCRLDLNNSPTSVEGIQEGVVSGGM